MYILMLIVVSGKLVTVVDHVAVFMRNINTSKVGILNAICILDDERVRHVPQMSKIGVFV